MALIDKNIRVHMQYPDELTVWNVYASMNATRQDVGRIQNLKICPRTSVITIIEPNFIHLFFRQNRVVDKFKPSFSIRILCFTNERKSQPIFFFVGTETYLFYRDLTTPTSELHWDAYSEIQNEPKSSPGQGYQTRNDLSRKTSKHTKITIELPYILPG